MSFQDHFSRQAAQYARARPIYPDALFDWLADRAPGRALAWDAGTGNGQAAIGLAGHFERVVATEPSAAQLTAAARHPRVEYHRSAETAPMMPDCAADLATAAQAVHWFDRDVYFAEVRRVVRPGGLVAVWTYELCQVSPEIDAAVLRFYKGPIAPYWPPERRHCETGYREIKFPFAEMEFPDLAMAAAWDLDELIAYLGSWSAVVRFSDATGKDPLPGLRQELAGFWGPPTQKRRVTWPLAGRVGVVGG